MRFVSAAIGAQHKMLSRGLRRSFARYLPGRILEWSDAGIEEKPYTIKPAAPAMAARGGDDVCWIDADQLVLMDVEPLLTPGAINAVAYGGPGILRKCGDGVSVPQADYVLGGWFSLPSRLVPEYVALCDARRDSRGAEGTPFMIDQDVLNTLATRHGVTYVDRGHHGLVMNFDGGIPPNHDSAYMNASLRGDEWWLHSRRIAMLPFTAATLADHIAGRFEQFHDPAIRARLCAFYDEAAP